LRDRQESLVLTFVGHRDRIGNWITNPDGLLRGRGNGRRSLGAESCVLAFEFIYPCLQSGEASFGITPRWLLINGHSSLSFVFSGSIICIAGLIYASPLLFFPALITACANASIGAVSTISPLRFLPARMTASGSTVVPACCELRA